MENVGEGEVGIILEALLEASAEQYSLDLSKKVLRGQRESRMKGAFLGGYLPLGYKLENKRLVEDENTAPIARYIFEEYAKGVPKKKIVDALNARGLRNSKGLPFALSTVHSVLKNKKYIGIYEHGGEEVAGGCDALLDERTFYKYNIPFNITFLFVLFITSMLSSAFSASVIVVSFSVLSVSGFGNHVSAAMPAV